MFHVSCDLVQVIDSILCRGLSDVLMQPRNLLFDFEPQTSGHLFEGVFVVSSSQHCRDSRRQFSAYKHHTPTASPQATQGSWDTPNQVFVLIPSTSHTDNSSHRLLINIATTFYENFFFCFNLAKNSLTSAKCFSTSFPKGFITPIY